MKRIAFVVVIAVLLGAPLVPADAGQLRRAITVEKVLVGPGPDGPYGFEIDCDGNIEEFELDAGESITGEGTAESCTITETDSLGADDVTYECEVLSGEASCVDDQTISWPVGAVGEARITVTNTFQEPTTTTTTSTTAPTTTTAAAAGAVVAQPAFTG